MNGDGAEQAPATMSDAPAATARTAMSLCDDNSSDDDLPGLDDVVNVAAEIGLVAHLGPVTIGTNTPRGGGRRTALGGDT